ncbi:acylphosphatase [Candidatus Daviesbacteria bacterium]|nr:acylphosphatase [Candidatus Daviesbacteria bacterium]
MKHLNIKVYGKVQGIFFRASAKIEADKLQISGFVRNEPDGSLYIEAEGEKEKLDEFVKWCHQGPSLAQVEKVTVTESQVKNFSQFEIYQTTFSQGNSSRPKWP